jgi:putative ABC transport system substrate-binding protein
MKIIAFFFLVIAMFNARALAEAQQPKRVYRIGILSPAADAPPSLPTAPNLVSKSLREMGYVEGHNLLIERRFAEGKTARLSELARELVQLRVDLILAVSPTAIRPAMNVTKTIPIVMGFGKDPVRDGFVASLARPGGNVTGVLVAPEDVLAGKRLELIKETAPRAKRIAMLATGESSSKLQIQEAEKVAAHLGVSPIAVEVQNDDYDRAFTAMATRRADALFVLASSILNANREPIIARAARYRLPSIYEWPEHVDAGGMMAYGSSLGSLSRRVATYIDRILKGAKPADLPVEQPTKFELVINLNTAKQIGLIIPPNVLARADKVVK